MICEKCLSSRESPLHFLTQCVAHSDLRLVMFNKIKQVIPNISILPKRQLQILIHGYSPENHELMRYNTKIMIATQNFIYDTKRCKKHPPVLPPTPPLAPPPDAI